MEVMTRVPKNVGMEETGEGALGRPKRKVFALSSYKGGAMITLCIPEHLVNEGDKIDFYVSVGGFAVQISAAGERAISRTNKTRTAGVPRGVRSLLLIGSGTTHLNVCEDRGGGLYFFPFSQFEKV